MPAKSAKQVRFMQMVVARKHGHKVGGPKVQAAARSISEEDAKDFTRTKQARSITRGRKHAR